MRANKFVHVICDFRSLGGRTEKLECENGARMQLVRIMSVH